MWDDGTIEAVWQKGEAVHGYDSNVYRKDYEGAWIKWDDYGDRDSALGWEIDHITPASRDGSDALYNLRPLHWKNNTSRQDGRLKAAVIADGEYNIDVETKKRL